MKNKIAPSHKPGATATNLNPVYKLSQAVDYGFRIDSALGRKSNYLQVVFDQKSEGGELRISFKDNKDLEFILERLEEFRATPPKNLSIQQDF